jgi:DNA polymerase-3 subunit delta
MYKDFSQFKKSVGEKIPSLSLIIAKEHRELGLEVLHAWHQSPIVFHAEDFNLATFTQEVETLPFFEKRRFVAIIGIDELPSSDSSALLEYIKTPNPATTLLLTAETLAANTKLFKEIEKRGEVLNLSAEKPWEREKHLIDDLVNQAANEGISIAPDIAKKLIMAVGKEQAQLKNELDKLICFIGGRKQITSVDIDQICHNSPQETLWQLGDALLTNDFKSAYSISRDLIKGGLSFFALLAHLKTQMKTQLEMLFVFNEGGTEAVGSAYPYLKGALLQKKIDLVKRAGKKRLELGYVQLVNTEIEAKNSNVDLTLLLELLLVKLCPSPSSPTS